MGEGPKQGFRLSFNRFLRVTFQGSRMTYDGGLKLLRELDEQFPVKPEEVYSIQWDTITSSDG